MGFSKRHLAAALLPLFTALSASAAGVISDFTEDKDAVLQQKKNTNKSDDEFFSGGGLRQLFAKSSDFFRIPGFMASAEIPEIGRLVGPANVTDSYRIGDTIYFTWMGAVSPRAGDSYALYTPALVLQSTQDPTEFSVVRRPEPLKIPDGLRLAGHFYESNGTIRITKLSQGVVHAVITSVVNQISLGDHLMPLLPIKKKMEPITGGIQLSAAVVAGSPVDRLSTTIRSIIYLNRGARDGIREGRIFQAIDSVKLDGAAQGYAPEVSQGEAMVIHVTDSFSTAMITKQFDVVRIGSLLKSKQEINSIHPNIPFRDLFTEKDSQSARKSEIPEVPDLGSAATDPSMPDPAKAEAKGLSELDAMEKSMDLKGLSTSEKAKLNKLSKQEKVGELGDEKEPVNALNPPSDKEEDEAKPAKKAKKKKASKKTNDEEELNQLMMQN